MISPDIAWPVVIWIQKRIDRFSNTAGHFDLVAFYKVTSLKSQIVTHNKTDQTR